jgi:hypothetical protein
MHVTKRKKKANFKILHVCVILLYDIIKKAELWRQ